LKNSKYNNSLNLFKEKIDLKKSTVKSKENLVFKEFKGLLKLKKKLDNYPDLLKEKDNFMNLKGQLKNPEFTHTTHLLEVQINFMKVQAKVFTRVEVKVELRVL
jgi:hypothetical protein